MILRSLPHNNKLQLHMSVVNHFRNKILSAQRNIHIIQILCRVPPKGVLLEGISCWCVENVIRVLDPFFFV